MNRILFLIAMSITFIGCAQQKTVGIKDVKEIWVYDYFNPRGYTTAGVAHKFQELGEDDNIIKFKLDTMFVESIKNMLLYSSTTRRTYQGKTGQNLIFAQFVIKNDSIRNITISPTGIVDYFVEHTAYFFVDDPDKRNKMLWMNDYYSEIMNKISPHSDSNNILLLNKIEGAYLNDIFKTTRKDFDFIGKKIAFLIGSTGTKESNKELYLEMQEKHSVDAKYPCDNGFLYIFDDVQKSESGGYDAAVVYWSKHVIPIEKVLKCLKNNY